jgi:hypothetical protein
VSAVESAPAKSEEIKVIPVQIPQPVAPTVSTSPNSLFQPVPQSSPNNAAAEAAVQETMSNSNPQPTLATPAAVQTPAPAASAVESAPAKPEEAKTSYSGKELKVEPIEAPPLPISSVKQTQLQDLLAKYNAELITAGQYQTERTKILADP